MSWLTRIRNAFRKDELDQDLADELRFHAEQRAAHLGISVEEAHSRLGPVAQFQQQSRDEKLAPHLESLLQDARIAVRLWRKHPITAAAAVLTITLGTGMAIAAFQLVWNVILQPLPYGQPDRLAQIWLAELGEERRSPQNLWVDEWRANARSFSHLATYRQWRVTITGPSEPLLATSLMVSSEFFAALEAPLLAGRAFTAQETRPGSDTVVILRERFARQRFPQQASALGESLNVDGVLCQVVGIVPDSFAAGPLVQLAPGIAIHGRGAVLEPDIFLPISRALSPGSKVPIRTNYAFGRLAPNATLHDAASELQTIAGAKLKGRLWLAPLEQEVAYQFRPALYALLGATVCVLLIACANLANLLLAQALLRQRELAVRSALGAGRARIVRQLLTEAMLVATLGGFGGIFAAHLLSRLLIGLYPDVVARMETNSVHPAIYAFALTVTLLIGLLIGALPAWRATGDTTDAALRVGHYSLSPRSRHWSRVLVALQVGLTALLLTAAGLLLNTFFAVRSLDLGLEKEHRITTSLSLPITRYPTRDDRARFAVQWLDRLATIPGVQSVGVSNSMPLRFTTLLNIILRIPGAANEIELGGRAVGGDYFQALGMRFAAGQPFDPRRKSEIVVNEAFAAKYFPGQSPVGHLLPQGKITYTITGVTRDVRLLGLREPAPPEVYLPYATFPLNPLDTIILTRLPADQIHTALRRELQSLDPDIPLGKLITMDELVDNELARPRFQAALVLLFAAFTLVLASLGCYGVIAHHVRSRVPELGLRRALGATSPDLLRLVIFDGLHAPLIGLALGLALGVLVMSRILGAALYGVSPHEPLVYFGVAATLILTSVLACLLPARDAVRIEPLTALRQD